MDGAIIGSVMRVRFGDYCFDSGTRELRRGDTAVHVSTKAFDLLEALISRRPNVVIQKDLYDLLWPDSFVEMANLHNLVSEVRAALADHDRQIVKTAYGIGFSFAAPVLDVPVSAGVATLSAWVLVVDGHRFRLPLGETVVGRSDDVSVRIARPGISRHHARITLTQSGATLDDLGSKNGTFVNRKRITTAVPITASDEIRFGKVRVLFLCDESTVSEETAGPDEG